MSWLDLSPALLPVSTLKCLSLSCVSLRGAGLCNPMDCSPPGSSSMELSRQEYWSGSPFPSPGDLPNPGIKPGSPALQEDSLLSELPGKPFSQKNWRKRQKEFVMSLKGLLDFSGFLCA